MMMSLAVRTKAPSCLLRPLDRLVLLRSTTRSRSGREIAPCGSFFSTTTTPPDKETTTVVSPQQQPNNEANNNSSSNQSRPAARPPRRRSDPTAKRPNRLCDPYGQGGQPLGHADVQSLLATLHGDWKVETSAEGKNKDENDAPAVPVALTREFRHADFLRGIRFLHRLAAVAELNAHFPSLHLERRIDKKKHNWRTVSTARCHTTVLGGLSRHDFYLAMLIDVEVDRPEAQKLLLPQDEETMT